MRKGGGGVDGIKSAFSNPCSALSLTPHPLHLLLPSPIHSLSYPRPRLTTTTLTPPLHQTTPSNVRFNRYPARGHFLRPHPKNDRIRRFRLPRPRVPTGHPQKALLDRYVKLPLRQCHLVLRKAQGRLRTCTDDIAPQTYLYSAVGWGGVGYLWYHAEIRQYVSQLPILKWTGLVHIPFRPSPILPPGNAR